MGSAHPGVIGSDLQVPPEQSAEGEAEAVREPVREGHVGDRDPSGGAELPESVGEGEGHPREEREEGEAKESLRARIADRAKSRKREEREEGQGDRKEGDGGELQGRGVEGPADREGGSSEEEPEDGDPVGTSPLHDPPGHRREERSDERGEVEVDARQHHDRLDESERARPEAREEEPPPSDGEEEEADVDRHLLEAGDAAEEEAEEPRERDDETEDEPGNGKEPARRAGREEEGEEYEAGREGLEEDGPAEESRIHRGVRAAQEDAEGERNEDQGSEEEDDRDRAQGEGSRDLAGGEESPEGGSDPRAGGGNASAPAPFRVEGGGEGTASRERQAVRGDPAVLAIEEVPEPRQPSDPGERSGPRNPGDEVEDRADAAEEFPLRRKHLHFLGHLPARKVQALPHPRFLERGEAEPPGLEGAPEPLDEARAERAASVVEDPAAPVRRAAHLPPPPRSRRTFPRIRTNWTSAFVGSPWTSP